jgi:3-phosphoshikimate 1-carboxyvinyltransferase
LKLTVYPGAPLRGVCEAPGDKSITHRAFLLAAIASGASRISNANPGADCRSTLACLSALGLEAERRDGTWHLVPHRLSASAAALDCGNSGTTLRLLPGILAAQPFASVLTGDASLSRRPVARIIRPLRLMGATLSASEGDRLPPLHVRGAKLRPVDYTLDVASAQVASCVLLAGTFAEGRTSVEIPGSARDHTERMLLAAGATLAQEPRGKGGRRVSLEGPFVPRGAMLEIPGDFSAAAFFLAAAAATPGSRVTARAVGLNPLRTGLLDVLEAMGARIERTGVGERMGEPVGDVTVTGPESLSAFDVPPDWVPRMIDEAPAWAVAACAARGTSRLSGAAELRVKESDRIALIARNLARLGIRALERPDGLEIEGGTPGGGVIEAADDHRIAMAFAVLGVNARDAVTIDDAASIATSYPRFAADLAALGAVVQTEGSAS